jgi:predicted MFS family arabinose efflux permease
MPIRWLMLGVLFLVRLAMGYQFQSVASVSAQLVENLGLSYAQVGTLIGLFLLPGIAIAIPSGALTRAVRDRFLLLAGAVAMIVGAVLMGSSADATSLYAGRLVTGIGGSIFNVILTKMVTEWFIEHELVTALAVMLSAWPVGISLGLVTQGLIADAHGWPWAMYATGVVAFVALVLTATLYRDPPGAARRPDQPLRFGLPRRQLIHVSIVGVAWTLYNMAIIIVVSFLPDVLVSHGYAPNPARSVTSLATWTMLLSLPLGGRLLEASGRITAWITATLALAAIAMLTASQGVAPEALCIAIGVSLGIPAGALMALSAEAVTPANRGPGLGVFFTWYYVGMTLGPAAAGWLRDVTGRADAPIVLGAAASVVVIAAVGALRLLQRIWPIERAQGAMRV